MNLIIDVGNTLVKLAVFNGDSLEVKKKVKIEGLLETLSNFKKTYPSLKRTIISYVGKLSESDLEYIELQFDLVKLNSETKLPFKNLYDTPKTLGVDRLALACAAVQQFPKKNALIIDAGTCITYDFVTCKKEYLGGAISPGIRMRYKALNDLTANLPLLEIEVPSSIIGTTTISSIHSGVVNGVLQEIEGIIKEYTLKYPDLTVILSGGNTNFLSKQLKSSIFANSNFLLEGLNSILQFNLR